MVKHMRKLAVLTVVVALTVALVGNLTRQTTDAANLTAGTYTYVINGEEYTFPFDPVKLQGGLLLPVEVFQTFGVTVEGALNRTITLSKPGVTAKVTLGTTTFDLDGQIRSLETAPMRLNGRLFIPAGLLRHFGVEVTQDGNFVALRDLAVGGATIKQTGAMDFAQMKSGRLFSATVKSDTTAYLNAEFTLLSEEMVTAAQFPADYGTRARLQGLLKTNTLVMAKLSNTSVKAGGLVANGFFLVDDRRRQYDLIDVLDTGEGPITAKITPNAERTGVLIFPKVAGDAGALFLYYDPNGATVGTFSSVR